MISRDFQSVSKLEANNETFFPSMSGIEIGRALYFCIFALVQTGESKRLRISEQSYLNRRYAHERPACVHAWAYIDSESLCHTLSTIEPRRTSNFVCHCTNFPSKRIIRVDRSGRRSIHSFSRNKISFHVAPINKTNVVLAQQSTERHVLRLSRGLANLIFEFRARRILRLISKRVIPCH